MWNTYISEKKNERNTVEMGKRPEQKQACGVKQVWPVSASTLLYKCVGMWGRAHVPLNLSYKAKAI